MSYNYEAVRLQIYVKPNGCTNFIFFTAKNKEGRQGDLLDDDYLFSFE